MLRNSQKTGLHESSPSPLFLSIKFLTTGHPPSPPFHSHTAAMHKSTIHRWIGTLSGCGPPEISDCRAYSRVAGDHSEISSLCSLASVVGPVPPSLVFSSLDLGPLRTRPCVSVPSLTRHSGRFSSLAKLRSPWPLRRLAPAPCEVPSAVRRRMPSKLLASRLLPVRGARPQLHVWRARPGHGPHAAASSPQAHPRALNEPK